MSAQLAADVEAIMTCSVAQVASEIEPEEMTMEELKNLNLPKGKYAGKSIREGVERGHELRQVDSSSLEGKKELGSIGSPTSRRR